MFAMIEGDLASLGELYRRHMRSVHGLCYRMTGSETEADDLVQETFLRVLRHRRSFRGQARFTTWLYRITRNVCLDHLRRTRRRQRVRQRHVTLEGVTSHAEAREPLWALPILERALARLPDEKRAAVILSRYYDLSSAEIAKILGCSVGTAKVRVHRALKELRGIVKGMERESDEVSGRRSADTRAPD